MNSSRCSEPISSSPSISHLMLTGSRPFDDRLHRFEARYHLPFHVCRSASKRLSPRTSGSKGGVPTAQADPAAGRRSGRRSSRSAPICARPQPLTVDYWMASSRHDLNALHAEAAKLFRHPLRSPLHIRVVLGSVETEGIVSTSFSSDRKRSRFCVHRTERTQRCSL